MVNVSRETLAGFQLCFSYGCGAAVLFYGDDKSPPRLRYAGTFLGEAGEALTVTLPDEPQEPVALLFLGEYLICTVRDIPYRGRHYAFSKNVVFDADKDLSLLTAQISALVHEAIIANANHNPSDYAGTIPVGVQ